MSEEKTATSADTAVAEAPKLPVGEAKVVNDSALADPVANAEKVHDDLVKAVAKKLDSDTANTAESVPPTKQPDAATAESEEPGKPEKTAGDGEGAKGESGSLSSELQTRAKGAGLSEDLAQSLHQSGQLEETLAAFDRSMIEYVQSKDGDSEDDSKEPPKDEGKSEKAAPPKDQKVPALDPEVYDEDLVKRDAYQQQRIDTLEKELEGFRSQVQELVEGQQGGFDEWFDGILTDLGCDTNDDDKCQSVFKAYGAMCDAFGTNVNARDKAMAERAYAAMYPQEVFKQKQRQTVDRLRDAEGKFLSSSKSKGGPPPKGATAEERQEHLVSNVTSYLKEQGVQMSGI